MKKSLIALVFLLTSCAANYEKIAKKTSQIGAGQGLETKIYQTKTFKIYTLQRIVDINKKVRVYFEGDGKAFIKKNIPSPNPTPTSFFFINLVAEDHTPNLVYIARPCQFVKDKKCYTNQPERYWTDARFSKEVFDSIDEVMKDFSKFDLELVGYSGGATIAKHVAAESQKKHKNILNFRTVAGNLDNKKFSEIHEEAVDEEFISDEEEVVKILEHIPQIHFVGENDITVPNIIAQTYLKKFSHRNCAKIIDVPGTSHSIGWKEVWPELLEIKPFCVSHNQSIHEVQKVPKDKASKHKVSKGKVTKNKSSAKGKKVTKKSNKKSRH